MLILRSPDLSATRPGQLIRSGGYIDDAYRAVGTQGDGLSNDGSTGIWPAATNLVTNGGFETNTIGYGLYTAAGTAGSLARVNTDAKFGGASLRVITTGDGVGQGFAKTSITGSTSSPYSVSMWVKAPVGALLTLSLAEYLAAAFVRVTGNSEYTGTGNWDRVTFSGTTGAGMDKLIASFFTRTSAQALTFYVDGFQIETGLVPTPYIETDGGTASRSAGRIQMPWDRGICTEAIGWAAGLVRMGHAYNSGVTTRLFQFLNSGTERIILQHVDNDAFYFERAHSGSNPSARGALSFALNDAVMWFAKWTPTDVLLSINGGAFASAGGNTAIPTLTTTFFDIGSNAGGGQQYADQAWCVVGNGLASASDPAAVSNAFGSLTRPKPTIRSLDQVARGAHAMAVWDGRTGTFQRRIGV